jgi:disulfide bond formation protein DsbB
VVGNVASNFFALLTVCADVVVVAGAALWIGSRFSEPVRRARARIIELGRPSALPIAWVAAMIATAGSLFYSEYAHFVPCELCWYQRIAMYPMTVILGIAALRRDATVWRYALPVVVGGGLISIYHYQLERFPSQGGVCDEAVPCTLVWVWKFHYISIPFMALSAFALIALCLLVARTQERLGETS